MANRSENPFPSNQPDFLKQVHTDLDPNRPSALGERRIVPDPDFKDPTDAALEHTAGGGGAGNNDKYFVKVKIRQEFLDEWKNDPTLGNNTDLSGYALTLFDTIWRRRNGSPRDLSKMRDEFAALEPGKDYRTAGEVAQGKVKVKEPDGTTRETDEDKVPPKIVKDSEIDFLLSVVSMHIVEYGKGRLTEDLRNTDSEGKHLKSLLEQLDRELGSTFSTNREIHEHYKMAALIKQTWQVFQEVRYDIKKLANTKDIIHIDHTTNNYTQAQALLITDIQGEHNVPGETRLIDIMARVQKEHNPAAYKEFEDYKDYGDREILFNWDGTAALQIRLPDGSIKKNPDGSLYKSEMQLLAQWMIDSFQTMPPISTEEAVAYLNGDLSEQDDAYKRCKYINFWGPKTSVLFGSLYPLLFLASGAETNIVLNLPDELLNVGLKGNVGVQGYSIPESNDPDNKNTIDVAFQRTDRGSWQEMFATYEEVATLSDSQIMDLARVSDMTSFHYMMTKLGQMYTFTNWIGEKTELKKGKPIGTREIAQLFLEKGSPGRELIKNPTDRLNYMFKWLDWAARREVSIMKRTEEVTERVGLELQDLMRSYFDAGRFYWLETSPINITEVNPSLWKPHERWRDVLFRLGEADQAVFASLKDDDGTDVVRKWWCKENNIPFTKFTKEQKEADLRSAIPGRGELGEGLFMVLKMYLGYGESSSSGDRRFYQYGRFGHIFNEGIYRTDGTTSPVTFEELLRFTGMTVKDGHLKMIGNREKKRKGEDNPEKDEWINYQRAIRTYIKYFADRERNIVYDIDPEAVKVLNLDLNVVRALIFTANTGNSAIDPQPGQPLRNKILPVVRDRSDLYRPVVDAAHIYIKYYDPDFYYGDDRLLDFQNEANERGALSRTGRPTFENSTLGNPLDPPDTEYHWGEVRNRLAMQQRYLDVCMSPLAIKPREQDLASIGVRTENIEGRATKLIRAADDDVIDESLKDYPYPGWVRLDSWQPRRNLVRVDNVRYASGSYTNLTKYPVEVCLSTMSHFENPMELIYLSLGRQIEVVKEATTLEMARLGLRPSDSDYMHEYNEMLPEIFVHNMSAQYVLTPGDHAWIYGKLLEDEMIGRDQYNELVLLSGCYTRSGLHHGATSAEGGQRAAFEATCNLRGIPDKDIVAEAEHSDKQTAEGALKTLSNLHKYLIAAVPGSELLMEPVRGQSGRNLVSGGVTGLGIGAIGLVGGTVAPALFGGAINPLLGLGLGALGFGYGAFKGRDRGARPSLISGIPEDSLMGVYAKYVLKMRNPELGLTMDSQTLDKMLNGTAAWNCIVDPKELPKAMFTRFDEYRKVYNRAHGLDAQTR